MPRRGTKLRDSYIGRYHAKPGVLVPGLTACRLAAALSERDLAKLVDSNQPTINNLEAAFMRPYASWAKADARLILRLSRALKVRPVDLMFAAAVEDKRPESERADSVLRRERD